MKAIDYIVIICSFTNLYSSPRALEEMLRAVHNSGKRALF